MCDPLTIAGIAMTAGSLAANQSAASKVAKARDSAIEAENIRQRGYDQEALALNEQSQGRYGDFKGKQDQKGKSLSDYFEGQAKPVSESGGTGEPLMPLSASNVVVQEEAKQLGKARQFGSQQDQALANMRAFGDLLGGISRDQANDAARIGIVGSFKKGSSGVLPLELEAANSAGAKMKMFGDILGAAGTVTTMAGLGGGWDKLSGWFSSAPASAGPAVAGGASTMGTAGPVSINPSMGWGTSGPVSRAPSGFAMGYGI